MTAALEVVSRVVPDEIARDDLAILTDAERGRAESMRHDGARATFVAGRSLLRRVLGEVEGLPPLQVPLAAVSGPPRLLGPGRPWISVSHAGGLVAVAWTRIGRLGIDLEPLDRDVDRVRLAPRVFAPEERADPDATDRRPFFERWTRKEAWLKAVGTGIGVPLRELVVTSGPAPRIVAVPLGAPDPMPPERWRLGALDLGPAHVGAWCVDAGSAAVEIRVSERIASG